MRDNIPNDSNFEINKEKLLNNKQYIIILKVIFILLFLYTSNKFNSESKIERLKYNYINLDKYKETINLVENGTLEIYRNPKQTEMIETKDELLYKTDIVFLVIPGGSYQNLGKPEKLPVAKKFFSLGYSSSTLNYSVYPKCYPTQYNQGLQAIKILSSKFKKIVLIGFSAGGHLAGLLGTTERKKLFNAVAMILCYPVISFSKKAHEKSRKNFFGNKIKNDEKHRELFSIQNRVNSHTLPTFIWTIKNDEVVPYENTLFMIEKLKENNVTFESIIYEKGRHGMALGDETAIRYGKSEYRNKKIAKWVNLSCQFIEKIIINN